MRLYYSHLLYNFGKKLLLKWKWLENNDKCWLCSALTYLAELKGIHGYDFEEQPDNGVSLFKL